MDSTISANNIPEIGYAQYQVQLTLLITETSNRGEQINFNGLIA